MTAPGITAWPATGIGEVGEGDDLVGLLWRSWSRSGTPVADGDVVVVTSKVVSKVEGRVVAASGSGPEADKQAAVAAGADRELARRGPTRIVRTHHGFVMAAAGVDASNVAAGSLVLLPVDPDASARRLRDGFAARGVRVGVVVSDTAGRPWRNGQTDIALGAAGLLSLDDHGGRRDAYGNDLVVTAPAVADEVAALAELATGKLSGSPGCLVRGLDRFVLPAGVPDPGAAALVRPESTDMFGLGAREAVLAALGPSDSAAARRGFGAPAAAEELAGALRTVLGGLDVTGVELEQPPDGAWLDLLLEHVPAGEDVGRATLALRVVAHAHGWQVGKSTSTRVRVGPRL